MSQWLRLWHDMPNDPKWRTIAKISKQSIGNVIAVYVQMLVNASSVTQSDAVRRGTLSHWCNEDIASALDLEKEQIDAIYEAMQGKVLDKDYLIGWDKRQPIREDNSLERTRSYRNRLKKCNSIEKIEKCEWERNVTQCDAPDTERKKERIEEVQNAQARAAPLQREDIKILKEEEVEPPPKTKPPQIWAIDLFDEAVIEVFGEEKRRLWPRADDAEHSQKFAKIGVDPGWCKAYFLERLGFFKSEGKPPPAGLKYFKEAVPQAYKSFVLERDRQESEPIRKPPKMTDEQREKHDREMYENIIRDGRPIKGTLEWKIVEIYEKKNALISLT